MWRSIVVVAGIMGVCGVASDAADVKPDTRRGNGDRLKLILPASLKTAMSKYNSKMQLREWDEYDPELVKFFREHHAHAVPWASWGDFDGDGRTDVALQMRDAEGRLFKLVVYHQRHDGQWEPYLLAQSRADLTLLATGKSISYLTLCPGRQSVRYWPEYDKARHVRTESDLPRMWLAHDAITSVAFGKAAVTYYWKNGKYQRIITAD